MFNVKKEHFNKEGFVPREGREEFSNSDQVMIYLKSWDKSHGYKHCVSVSQVRARLIEGFCRKVLNIHGIKRDEQMELVFQNFKIFKDWLNKNHTEDTMSEIC